MSIARRTNLPNFLFHLLNALTVVLSAWCKKQLMHSTREKLTGYDGAGQIENLESLNDAATSPAAIAFKDNRLSFAWLDGDVQKVKPHSAKII